ncbi:hypothetical protein B5F74_01670 [Collinsella sp. An271]|nr:hypothetical protein B5F74_01670 [Collinsella sp. An271]
MTVSAIVPVYNVEQYLERCLESIRNQTRPFDEVILVDDGSTDRSGKICEEWAFSNPTFHVVHQRNGGLSAARNKGVELYTGDCVAFIDSDDWIAKDFVEVLLNLLVRTDSDIAIGQWVRTDGEDGCPACSKVGRSRERVYEADEYMSMLLRIRGNRALHYAPSKLYRRSVVEDGHFPLGILNEDVEGAFKFALNASRVAETGRVLYYYYRNASSITGSSFGENYLNLSHVWQRVEAIAESRAPEWAEACGYNVMRADFTILCDMLLHGDEESDKRYSEERDACLGRLRGNMAMLLKGPMPINRKIAALIISAMYLKINHIIRKMR